MYDFTTLQIYLKNIFVKKLITLTHTLSYIKEYTAILFI